MVSSTSKAKVITAPVLPAVNPALYKTDPVKYPKKGIYEMDAEELCSHMNNRSYRILNGLPYKELESKLWVNGEIHINGGRVSTPEPAELQSTHEYPRQQSKSSAIIYYLKMLFKRKIEI